MEGMSMPMTTATQVATALATALEAAASGTSIIPAAVQTEAAPHNEESSSPLALPAMPAMQGMQSSIHFGIGDTFFAPFFTPTQVSGYVAVMLFLVMLSFSQRLLMAVEAKAAKKLHQQPQTTADVEENPAKTGIWSETVNPESSGGPGSSFISRALIKSVLQVLNASLGFLVMLGVMTLNAGYMMALLLGMFLGELLSIWAYRKVNA
ncbi:uncharacterized protein A1O9_09447 [Exophiala aquamarina CBS 119918]|uniref:Copper transport protein n=1 Tax=Exophiala aquamarina CBS 119918 TaxID=1182545 RepID=A0A072P398_9EURO|nr:uncharacterized protein A1O9_09447 [Exophiala aquamarina CBS 119918]KEF54281.1 hypothetical protein A1O9_09447 [Exophiala aquamarina CBS 119918]